MPEIQLAQILKNVGRRIGQLGLWRRLAWTWISFSGLLSVWAAMGRPLVPFEGWLVTTVVVAVSILICSKIFTPERIKVARQIEKSFPDLNSRLLAALEQVPDPMTGNFNALQRQLISEAIQHSRTHNWPELVSQRQMTRAFLGQITSLFTFATVALCCAQAVSKSSETISKPDISQSPHRSQSSVSIEPGDAERERGSRLLVLARFPSKPPANVIVTWAGQDAHEHRMALTQSLDDPVFAALLPPLEENIKYQIEFDGQQTPTYRIEVYDLPSLVRSDWKLKFPEYTTLSEKILENASEVSVVEGTRIEIRCQVNKILSSAKLISGDGTSFELKAEPSNPTSYFIQFAPEKSLQLRVELIDETNRTNRDPEEFRIEVIPNRVPELAWSFPGKDVKPSPLEEISIEGSVIDDFGILDVGLVTQVNDRDPIRISTGKALKPSERHKIATVQRLEDFRVQPDELITFYLYAVDYGPDGIPRQTNSDLFFAEVRSFDEIYRQIEQNSPIEIQSQQKPPESIGKLIELQRQIMVATWKEVRVARPTVSSDSFKEIGAIRDSQQQAIQKLQDLRSRMTQAQLQPFFHDIEGNMERALKQLQKSLEAAIFQPLVAAVVAEQSSYQGLLKLRSKEHLLVQAQGTGNAPEQEEKTDLELKRNQDRYESEQAGTKKDESNINREALAILDRLKEIVRRQEGINQQTRDLEAQSRQAKTETERADVERQLKRLREEQQQLLHDADELRSKLNQSMQQETVNSTRERLEQTRQRMVDTVEKLREGQISQALNSGTRTERELKQISEDFRKQTAAQFAEALRELRDNSRGLVDREKQLGEQLNQLGDSLRPTLRATQGLAQLEVQFHQQQQQLNDVLERIKRVVEQAESSEPLLAKQLYDILRSTREMQLEEAINATQKHLRQGTIPEAVRTEAHVQAGINRLKGGIEKAAESVLGNEVDSLKRARRELAELSQLIHREIQSQGQTDTISSESKESSTSIVGGSKSAKATDDDKSPVQSNRASDAGSTAETQNQNALTASNSSLDLPNNAMPGDSGDAGPSSKRTSDGNFTAEKSKQAGLRSKKSPGRTAPSPGQEGKRGDDSGDGGTSGNEQGGGPLTGGNYSEFNERLRDIESMVSEPQLQAEVQKVRDRARQVRAEFKRHSNSPNWDLVKSSVHQPMLELQMRLSEEIAKRESPDSLVPVDRDPVPSRYRGLVRLYYERLGAGKDE